MRKTHTTFCRICEALCGLEVDVEDGRVVQIRPDERHISTDGFACAKGLKQHKMYDSPDRLLHPMKRVGSDWHRVSWDQALCEIGEKVKAIRADTGPDSIAMYVGTAAGFGVLHPAFAQGFMTGLGSKSMYSSATQDCANKFAVARHVYGFPFTQPFPDLDHLGCLIITGANPVISKWSFLQVSNPIKRLREMEERGAKIYVVDPRRTETAKVAGEHVYIRPGTDVFYFLSFLHELIATGGVDRARVSAFMRGFDEIAALVAPWTPERTAEVTRIAPQKLREMVAAYREADGAAMYCSTGVNMGGNGSLAFWLQEAINAVSGNLDRRGGTLVGMGISDFIAFGKKTGTLLRTDRSRVGGFTMTNDAFPGGILAEEILTPGHGQVRALFVTGGNPLITMANAGRLKEAFEKLELLVTLDIFRTETASLAHYALPCTSPLQRPDLPFIFPLMLGMQSRPYLQATRAVVPPQGEQRDEATIYLDLARACGVSLFGSTAAQKALEMARAVRSLAHPDEQPSLPQEALLSALLRVNGQGSFASLLREEHGRPRPDHEPGTFLGKRVITDDGRIDLAPPLLLQQASKLDDDFARELAAAGRLKLITRRAVTTHNSWTHNLEEFVEADRSTNYLYMHPDDARAAGLCDGALADVSTDTATVRVPVKLHAELMPGTVALPHGWGHQHAVGLSVASRTTGVNVNLLAADGPERIEKVSGMAHLSGFLVDVRPAAGEIGRDWSGIARP
ncbi:MAG TPA: molybdopterin-dependent oxidoreductase [Candidatus Limnocylindrales bacterium]|nr:molybdopterin-dependent oxidoreductase [Candidatus Limnocylindrales bacterium]